MIFTHLFFNYSVLNKTFNMNIKIMGAGESCYNSRNILPFVKIIDIINCKRSRSFRSSTSSVHVKP